ncbi:MAG: prepilin-type N-terminal cleavage/methylation domain-containing protein [Candidatus Omnitrophota bacterium]
MKNKKGFTIIELVITTLVVAVMGAVFAGMIVFFVQMFLYSPRQLDTQKIAQELDKLMIEGTPNIRGIRYAKSTGIIDASATQFTYTYGCVSAPAGSSYDDLSVRFRWNAGDKHIYRSTNSGAGWSTESQIPVFITSNINIDGKGSPSVIFTYKKANDAAWVLGTDPVNTIRRVIISITVNTGSGSFTASQGTFNFTTSTAVKGF